MTPETRKTLTKLIDEYGHALTRIQAEKELMKLLEARAAVERALELVDDEDEGTREELRELLASL